MIQKFRILFVALALTWLIIPKAVAEDLVASCLGSDPFRKVDETISACTSALTLPNLERSIRAKIFALQGEAFYRKPKPTLAVAALNSALGLDASLNDARIDKGWALVDLHNYDEATKLFVEADKADPKSARASFALGWMQFNVTGGGEFVSFMEEALRRDPSFWLAHSNLAYYFSYIRKDSEAAIFHYNAILNAPENEVNKTKFNAKVDFRVKEFYAEVLLDKGEFLNSIDRLGEAEVIFKRLAQQFPREALPLADLADVYYSQARCQLGFDTANEGLALDPESISALLSLEMNAVVIKKNEEALQAFAKIENSKRPNNDYQMGIAYYFAAMAQKAIDRRTEARRTFMMAFRFNRLTQQMAITQFVQSGYYDGNVSDPFTPRVEAALDACLADEKCLSVL